MSGKSSGSSDTARSRSPSRDRPAQCRHRQDSLVCKPLRSLSDITEFLNSPPAWRSLCIDLRSHSDDAVRNMDIVRQNHAAPDPEIKVEHPETFCHLSLDKEEVRRHRRSTLPQTLVCHDMANGYHDDCYIDGTGNNNAYTFYNWAVVDIFCYFSHHFITIPPLGWINVGHAHGVKVIGTVITEWGDGAATWEALLADPEEWKGFACNLVAIAKMLKFDGWLLNIENKISKPTELVEFVRYLHGLMHRELAAPLLLWYDSVAVDGALAWQNGLTHKNKAFFDACDGIFTNYSWREEHVAAARAAAGARARDVFVGIDVWGRNFLGGGQFNTQEAVKIAHKHGLSLAIFAPAWTHEACAQAPGAALRERALWGSLWPLLHSKLPAALPFATAFCRGRGPRRRLCGEVLGPTPWYNLRHQQYQPNAAIGPHGYRLVREPGPGQHNGGTDCQRKETEEDMSENDVEDSEKNAKGAEHPESNALESECAVLPVNATITETKVQTKTAKRYQLIPVPEETACLELYMEDSFTGGGCLLVNPEPDSDQLIKLFHCDFYVPETVVVCVVTKTLPDYEEQFLNIVLSVNDRDGRERRVVLVGSSGAEAGVAGARAVPAAAGQDFKALQRYLLLHQPGFYVSVENPYGWTVRYFTVAVAGGRVRALGARVRGGPLLLGQLALCHKFENMD